MGIGKSFTALCGVVFFGMLNSSPNAHEDLMDGPRGVEQIEDPIRGQGHNQGADRAYAWWGQGGDNTTDILDRPKGQT